ncbi:MAG: type II toxin-antitoxin system mRNA interferase toxin, RelE/StbE family [Patescibacteria group bacterium]
MHAIFDAKFKKMYAKVSKKIKIAFNNRLDLFLIDRRHPLLDDHALSGKYLGYRSINITGNFRAIYTEVSKNIFRFVAIGTHPQLYGK